MFRFGHFLLFGRRSERRVEHRARGLAARLTLDPLAPMGPRALEPLELKQLMLGATVEKEGWLWKCAAPPEPPRRPKRHAETPHTKTRRRGARNTAYKKRWFVLTTSGSVLYYKARPAARTTKPSGATGLFGAAVRRVPKSGRTSGRSAFRAALEVEADAGKGRRTYCIEAESEIERDAWATAFARAAQRARRRRAERTRPSRGSGGGSCCG